MVILERISIRTSVLEFDSGSETGSPAGTPVIARIKDNYVSSPAASKVIARLKENNGIPCRKGLKSARNAARKSLLESSKRLRSFS